MSFQNQNLSQKQRKRKLRLQRGKKKLMRRENELTSKEPNKRKSSNKAESKMIQNLNGDKGKLDFHVTKL